MANPEEHPFYIGKLAGLPVYKYFEDDDLTDEEFEKFEVKGLHLKEVEKNKVYYLCDPEYGEYTLSVVPGINKWKISDDMSYEFTNYGKNELDDIIYHAINILNADKAHEDDEDDTPDSDNEDDIINFVLMESGIYSAFNHLNKIYEMEKKYGLKESNKHVI